MSDIEGLSSQTFRDESDAEDAQAAERAKKDLEEKVAFLSKENNVLRAQFSSAVKITDQLRDARLKNEKLSASIREMSAEKEDLLHRLEILHNSYEDVSAKMEAQKSEFLKQHHDDEEGMKLEFKRVKAQYQAQIDQLTSELENEKEANNAFEIEQKSFDAKLFRLIDSCSYYFQKSFDSIDDLYLFVENKQPKADATQQKETIAAAPNSPMKVKEDSEMLQALKQKTKGLQKLLKNAQNKQQDAELENKNLRKQLNEMELRFATQERETEAKIHRIQEECDLKSNDQQHQIALLSNKVENLKSGVQRSRSLRETTIVAPQQQTIPQIPQSPMRNSVSIVKEQNLEKSPRKSQQQLSSQRTVDPAFEQIVSNNSELSKQLSESKAKMEKLQADMKNQQENNLKVLSENEQLKTQIVALTHVKEEQTSEIDTLRTALRSQPKENPNEKHKSKKEMAAAKSKISKLEATIENQKKMLLDTQIEIEKANSLAKESREQAQSYQNEIAATNERLKKANNEIIDLQRKIDDFKPPEEIPSYAFRVADFEPELVASLDKVGSNKSLQIVTRIQTALKQTANYYSNKVNIAVKDTEKAVSVVHSIRNSFGTFLVDLSIAATGVPSTFDDFVSNNSGVQLVNAVEQLRSERDEYCRRAETSQSLLNSINEIFNIDGDVVNGCAQIRDNLERNNSKLQQRTKKAKDFKASYESLKRRFDNAEKESAARLEEALNLTQKLNGEIKVANEESSSLRRQVQDLTIQLREARENHENIESQLNEEQEENAQNLAEELSRLDTAHRDEISNLANEINEANAQIEDNEEEISSLKQLVLAQKKQIEELNINLQQTKKENEIKLSESADTSSSEKRRISESYETVISQLRSQSEAFRNDIEKLSNDLNMANKKIKETKDCLFNTKRDKFRLEAELKARCEELEREKALSKSTHEVDLIEAEARLSQKISQKAQENEKDKRDIITYFANEFSEYNLANGPMDERLFKTLVTRAHSLLSRLSASDASIRRLVHAADRQTTEDAVAQLLISH